jgi:hypothetical protein
MCLLFGNVHGEGEDSDSDDEPPPKLANIPHQTAEGETIGEWVFRPKKGNKSTVPKGATPKLLVPSVQAPALRVIQAAPANAQTVRTLELIPALPAPATQASIAVNCIQPLQTSQAQIPRVYTSAVGGWYLSCHNCPPPSGLFTSTTRGACAHIGLVNGNGSVTISEPASTPATYYTQYMLGGRHIAVANHNPKEILLFQDGAWRPAQIPLVVQSHNEAVADNSGNRIQLLS